MTVCVICVELTSQTVLCYIPSIGVEISVREPEYSVGESESSVTICAGIISGEAAIPVEAVLMTVSDGNAQGKCSIAVHTSARLPINSIIL